MNEKHLAYAEVKHIPSKKQMQKEKRNEQLVYAEVKMCTSKPNQTKITRMDSPKEKGPSVPLAWFLATVILGIFCFFLLLTVGILGFKVFQGGSWKPSLNNETQEDNMSLREKTLTRGKEISTCRTKWSCCGQKCYYFSNELKNFKESQHSCKEMGSTLLKIDDQEELIFIQSHLSYFYWIGLSRKSSTSYWTWEDNTRHFLDFDWKDSKDGNCASISAKKITATDCAKLIYYICEK